MAKTTMQFLENFKKGDYMCWHVCSQCANTGSVVLRDDSTVYFEAKKASRSTDLQHLKQGGAYYTGGTNLRVEFTVDTGTELQTSSSGDGILDNKGRNVGFIYTFCIEDSVDSDFNDFYVNVVAWKRKG
jgi:hypothetical protein